MQGSDPVNDFATLKSIAKAVWLREGTVRTCRFGPYSGIRFELTPAVCKTRMSIFYKSYEPEVTEMLSRLISPGMVVYDVGAHVGVHSLYMAKLLKGRGSAYAFEPWPENYAALERNVRLNLPLSGTVVPVREAVGADNGFVEMVRGSSDGRHHLRYASEEADVIAPCTTLDAFVTRRNHPAPSLVKIDVEGMEGPVLAGAAEMLRRHRPALLIEHHRRVDTLSPTLRDFNYSVKSLGARHLYAC
jgi:FkbM family methyltransferase